MGNISTWFKKHRRSKKRQSKEVKKSNLRECGICLSVQPNNNKYFPKIEGCTHREKICFFCLDRHVLTEINMKGNIKRISCPITNCAHVYGYNEIRKIVKYETFQRYDHLITMKILATRKEFRWCKAEGCESGQIHDDSGDHPIVICHACKSRSCYVHDVPWHYDKTCNEFELELENVKDMATINYKKENTKSCPKCNVTIEKNGGCDHITCQITSGGCGHEFCWLCLEDYSKILEEGNHLHDPNCNYFVSYDEETLYRSLGSLESRIRRVILGQDEEDSETDDDSSMEGNSENDDECTEQHACPLCGLGWKQHVATWNNMLLGLMEEESDIDKESDEEEDLSYYEWEDGQTWAYNAENFVMMYMLQRLAEDEESLDDISECD